MTTAVNAVVQVEPFKFFHNMNDSIRNYQEPTSSLTSSQSHMSNVGIHPERSNKPAGIAHLGKCCVVLPFLSMHPFRITNVPFRFILIGFICHWPNGGGLEEENTPRKSHHPQNQRDMWASEDEDDETEDFDD